MFEMEDGEYIKKERKKERERKILDNVTKFSTLFIIRLAVIRYLNFVKIQRVILFVGNLKWHILFVSGGTCEVLFYYHISQGILFLYIVTYKYKI